MTDERLDRWRDQMVAALYDELDARERSELESELERDPELAREWRELREARDWLGADADGDAGVRGLDLLLPARNSGAGTWRRAAMAAGAGFAAAASLFVVLLLAGLRVDATEGSVVVRFAEPGGATAASAVGAGGGPTLTAPDARPVTREEFAHFADLLVRATSSRLDDLERRQSANQMELVGALYDALAVDQRRQYDDLRARLDTAIVRAAMTETGSALPKRR